jgi:hypothetical protein
MSTSNKYSNSKIIKIGNTVIGAEFYQINTGAKLFVKAKRVIDATELGDALASAKISYDLGMESNDVTGEQVNLAGANDIIQDITYVGILKDYGSPQPLIPRPIHYDSTEFDGSNTSFYKDTNRKRPSVDAKKMLEYGKLPNNKYMLNWPIYGNDIYLNVVEKTPKQREELLEQAKQQTLRFIYFIQKDLGFNHLALADDEFPTKDKLALYPYHRESRRMHGMVRMLVQHISKPFDTPQPLYTTGIAVGDYPVDHHHKKNSAAPQHLEFFPVPSFNIPMGALIPKGVSNFIVAALKGEDIEIYGDGTQTRSFCYVDDLVEGITRMFNQEETPGPINLGSLYEHSMIDLAKTVIALTGSKSKVINKPLPIDDPKQRQPDLTLARKYLNWEPSIEPEVGLEKTIKYFASVI